MPKHLLQIVSHLTLGGMILLMVGVCEPTFAETPQNSGKKQPHLTITASPQGGMQLEVQQMPLAQVLDTLTAKTRIPIHYSALPEGLVTAYCAGATFKETLECLLASKADLVIRYPQSANADNHTFPIDEIWIVGSTPASHTTQGQSPSVSIHNNEDARIVEILDKAQSQNPQERADAMAALLAEGNTDNPDVTAALEQALNDEDPSVRSQALSSYAHHENSTAVTEAIRAAMNDRSADVRLMAVDNISNDVELLQQASNDPDETIRALAAMKLEALTPAE